jgi:hypothetical protein
MLDLMALIERLMMSHMHLLWQVFYVVSKELQGWNGGKGHVTKDVLKKGLPCPSDDTLILVTSVPSLPPSFMIWKCNVLEPIRVLSHHLNPLRMVTLSNSCMDEVKILKKPFLED